MPVAHAEGKFIPRNQQVLGRLRENDQIVFRYAAPDGGRPKYPWNPNGSVDDIAGVCDTTGRVLGMMPHPERFIDMVQHPNWTREKNRLSPDGMIIFSSACQYVRDKL
jgi:phosphoribosylformylglycinamidine synthase